MKGSNELSITVVVPVYNRPELIVRCLESLRAQTWRPLQVIVVDNASTDNTLESVCRWSSSNQYSNFQVQVLSETRRGAAFARQKGLRNCYTDKVLFLDSDDSIRPDAIETVMKTWKENPSADIVAWPIEIHDGKTIRRSHSVKGNLLERHLVHAIFMTVAYAAKTEYMKSIGGWRGAYPVWDDLELGTRVLLPGPRVVALRQPLIDVYPQEVSITGLDFSSKAGLWERSLDGCEESIRESARPDSARLVNIISYRRAILAADYAKEGRSDLALPLFRQALAEVTRSKRPLIWFSYHWTRLRLRGAFRIVGPLL